MSLPYATPVPRRDYVITKVKLDLTKTWTQSTFSGNVQPATGRDLQEAPEGNWSTGAVKVYSNIELKVKKSGQSGTYIKFENDWYELAAKLPYVSAGPFIALKHYKYLAAPRTNKEVGL
jgi:hypothetical protein